MDVRPPLQVVASNLARVCTRVGVDYALIGGFAAGAYGSTIDTKDVDACVNVDGQEEVQIAALLEGLQQEGFRINGRVKRTHGRRGDPGGPRTIGWAGGGPDITMRP